MRRPTPTSTASPLALGQPPAPTASRFLQLAVLKVTRWQFGGIGPPDRPLLVLRGQREGVRRTPRRLPCRRPCRRLGGSGDAGWRTPAVHVNYLNDSPDFDTLNLLVEAMTPEASRLDPPTYARRHSDVTSDGLLPRARSGPDDRLRLAEGRVLASAAALHELLARGPFAWWRRIGPCTGQEP